MTWSLFSWLGKGLQSMRRWCYLDECSLTVSWAERERRFVVSKSIYNVWWGGRIPEKKNTKIPLIDFTITRDRVNTLLSGPSQWWVFTHIPFMVNLPFAPSIPKDAHTLNREGARRVKRGMLVMVKVNVLKTRKATPVVERHGNSPLCVTEALRSWKCWQQACLYSQMLLIRSAYIFLFSWSGLKNPFMFLHYVPWIELRQSKMAA